MGNAVNSNTDSSHNTNIAVSTKINFHVTVALVVLVVLIFSFLAYKLGSTFVSIVIGVSIFLGCVGVILIVLEIRHKIVRIQADVHKSRVPVADQYRAVIAVHHPGVIGRSFAFFFGSVTYEVKESQQTRYNYSIKQAAEEEYEDEDFVESDIYELEEPEQKQLPPPEERIHFSDDFQPHADVILSGRGSIFGISGSGKSNTIAVTCEDLGRLEVPFLLADTEDEYRSLCAPQWMPHGALAGAMPEARYKIRNKNEAAMFGNYLLDKGLQIILNLASYETADDAAQIMIGIIAGLKGWEEAHDPVSCMFLLDEAAVWLPQNTQESALSEAVLAELQRAFFSDLVRRGRKRGLGLTLATQRVAEIDKRALQSNWKILHRQTEENDLKRYRSLGITDEETSGLLDGEAFVFTSQVRKLRTRLRYRQSPDASKTPGLATVRRHMQQMAQPEEDHLFTEESSAKAPEISARNFGLPEGTRNAFVADEEPFQGYSEISDVRQNVAENAGFSPAPEISDSKQQRDWKDVPEDIRQAIIQLRREKKDRTKIQEQLELNGDEYWMVKAVCDQFDQRQVQKRRLAGKG